MQDFLYAKRSSNVVYALVTNKYATLKELRDDYNIWEVLDLYEMMLVSMTNKMIAMERRMKKDGRIH